MNKTLKKDIIQILISINFITISLFIQNDILKTILLIIAYFVVGFDILKNALKTIKDGGFLDENFLMSIASIAAFCIGEEIEAVAIMLFYRIGEAFEEYWVHKSRKSIQEVMAIAPDYANVKRDNTLLKIDPNDVLIGEIIIIKPGEKVPLDCTIINGNSSLNTSALTGEFLPTDVKVGDKILSGSVNINGLLEAKVTNIFQNSTVNKILELVEESATKKSKSEKFITKFAKYYTPIVVFIALFLATIFPLVFGNFSQWLYKAIIFLVVSCPCALVVSVPLSFFIGIGSASKKGILIKGSSYLENLSRVKIFVFDKTGTLTKGEFSLKNIVSKSNLSQDEILKYAAYTQTYSSHPIAKSIIKAYAKDIDKNLIKNLEEIPGYGIKATINDKEILIGSKNLLNKFNLPKTQDTSCFMAMNDKFVGYLSFEDTLRDSAKETISWLKNNSIKTIMLTGDKNSVATNLTKTLNLDEFYAELLPADKVENLEKLLSKKPKNSTLAYIGDGINDAPVLARADIGIAMLGTDAAMEAGDIILMKNKISSIKTAILIAKKTVNIAYQNIFFAIGIKMLVMIFAILGFANIWLAIFADVGVTILAILNSFRVYTYSKNL